MRHRAGDMLKDQAFYERPRASPLNPVESERFYLRRDTMNRILIWGISILLISCLNAYAASCETPSFLTVGKDYVMVPMLPGSQALEVKVLEIDKKNGWVKVKSKDNRRDDKIIWVNLINVLSIFDK
jgi:hypothetical protein